jgi:hypothetical protein
LAYRKIDGAQTPAADTDLVRGEGEVATGLILGQLHTQEQGVGDRHALAGGLQAEANPGHVAGFEAMRIASAGHVVSGKFGF